MFVEVALAAVFRLVENLKELGEERAEVGAVLRGALLDPLAELLALKDGVVFREEAEEDTYQK